MITTSFAIAVGWFLLSAAAADESPSGGSSKKNQDFIASISSNIVWDGSETGVGWFQTRACMVPTERGRSVLMTLQPIMGSDFYGPVHWAITHDGGRTWSKPEAIPGFEWHKADGLDVATCDVVPEYHPKTDTVLAIGHNVYYKNNRFFRDQPPRWPVYAVRKADGHWVGPKKLEWNDPRGAYIYTCGCAQRITLPSGDVIVPISFGDRKDSPRAVCTLRCTFDGDVLTVQEVGDELKFPVKRGFLEPSLAEHVGRYYMTIRAEDERGYVATSSDGLKWSAPKAWAWDDGAPIEMSTTQQRWLPHGDALYLVYTRRDESNANVSRWRAPLYVARVDAETLRLVRDSEQIAIPLSGDGVRTGDLVPRMGNFHTVAVSPTESWVTVGEARPADDYNRGKVFLSRIRWKQANKLVD